MDYEITLRPEELLVLGQLMQAKTIDYDYLSSMSEVRGNYPAIRAKCIQRLSHNRLIRERLSGEVRIHPQAEPLLKCIFFGTLETGLDTVTPGAEKTVSSLRLHHYEGSCALVTREGESLRIRAWDPGQILPLVRSQLGTHRATRANIQYNRGTVTKLLLVKRAKIGSGCVTETFLEQEGGLYHMGSDGRLYGVSDAAAAEFIATMLKEG